MHNIGLLIMNKTETHCDLYFEMYMLYYFRLLIQKDKGDKICTLKTIYNILQYKHHNVNTGQNSSTNRRS